jgi:tripartite-type tricarboxylate transporter receptor subunit TctC
MRPPPIIARPRGDQRARGQPALEAQGAKPVGGTLEELAAVIATDTVRWGRVIRDADIRIAP